MELNRTFIILQKRVDEINSLIAETKNAMTAFVAEPNGESASKLSSSAYKLQGAFYNLANKTESSLEEIKNLERSAIALSSILRWNKEENSSEE